MSEASCVVRRRGWIEERVAIAGGINIYGDCFGTGRKPTLITLRTLRVPISTDLSTASQKPLPSLFQRTLSEKKMNLPPFAVHRTDNKSANIVHVARYQDSRLRSFNYTLFYRSSAVEDSL